MSYSSSCKRIPCIILYLWCMYYFRAIFHRWRNEKYSHHLLKIRVEKIHSWRRRLVIYIVQGINIFSLILAHSALIPFSEFRTSVDKYDSISEVRNVQRINELCKRLSDALSWKSFSRNMPPILTKWTNPFKLYIRLFSVHNYRNWKF